MIFERIKFPLILIFLFFTNILLYVNKFPITIWDESRLALSALEMSENSNLLISTFNHQPDLWNTKPPLLIWLQAVCFHFFGISEWVFRIPTLLAVALTLLVIIHYSKKLIGDFNVGYIASIVLISTPGYASLHIARTGDYDGLLTLFTTTYTLAILNYLHGKKSNTDLGIYSLALSAALMTKGIAGGIMLFSIFGALLIMREKNIRDVKIVLATLAGFIIPFIFYVLRENAESGYISAVFENEILGRYFNINEEHQQPFYFYFQLLFTTKMGIWMGVGIILFLLKKQLEALEYQILLIAFIFLIVISISQTKLYWYIAPVYPFFAWIVGVLIFKNQIRKILVKVTFAVVTISLSAYITQRNINTEKHVLKGKDYVLTPLFYKHPEFLEEKTVIENGYFAHHLFYSKILQKSGVKTQYTSNTNNLIYSKIIAYQEDIIARIEADYKVLSKEKKNNFWLIFIEK